MNKGVVYIGADHAGYEMKEALKKYLTELGYKFLDLGSFSMESVDFPDIAREVCEKVVEDKKSLGVLVCGTGTGMAMSANKRAGIRAAVCINVQMAELARGHNDANVLCIGARITTLESAKEIVKTFLATDFSNEERHVRRIEKMMLEHSGKPAEIKEQD